MILVLAAGLQATVSSAGLVFDVLRLSGAAYLVWLGIKARRGGGQLCVGRIGPRRSRRALFWQGVLVIWSNPKALLFFGAFIPQFVDPSGDLALHAGRHRARLGLRHCGGTGRRMDAGYLDHHRGMRLGRLPDRWRVWLALTRRA